MVNYRYTPEVLARAAAVSHSIAGVMRELGIKISGGSHAHISRRLKLFGIDTSHFTGQAHNRGKRDTYRLTPDQVLVRRPAGSRRTPGRRLGRALRQRGVPHTCAACGVGTIWQGRPLNLHVDHIDGDFLNNEAANLRFLCPNCHTQTATYANHKRTGQL